MNYPRPFIQALPMPCKTKGGNPTILITEVLNDELAIAIYETVKGKAMQTDFW
jgi:hypothetical protein